VTSRALSLESPMSHLHISPRICKFRFSLFEKLLHSHFQYVSHCFVRNNTKFHLFNTSPNKIQTKILKKNSGKGYFECHVYECRRIFPRVSTFRCDKTVKNNLIS